MTKPKPKPPAHAPQHLDCHTCGAQCCRYFALQIDTPTDAEEFDYLRWYISHQDVAIFIEGPEWYLQINRSCRHLTAEGSCGIYETRPQICREYGWDPTGKKECHGADDANDHDYFFTNLAELEAYLKAKGIRWASQAADQSTPSRESSQ